MRSHDTKHSDLAKRHARSTQESHASANSSVKQSADNGPLGEIKDNRPQAALQSKQQATTQAGSGDRASVEAPAQAKADAQPVRKSLIPASLLANTRQLFRLVKQFVKPASKGDAENIIKSTGAYYQKGVVGGGKKFGNREGNLPKDTTYTEYDVNPYTGKNRGAERLVKGANGKVYYTNDHYQTFTEL